MWFKINFSILIVLLASFIMIRILSKGSHHSFRCAIFNIHCPTLQDITLNEGSKYDPKFESIIHKYKQNFVRGEEIGSQLTIYIGSKRVVDVSSGPTECEGKMPFTLDKLNIVYSSTKVASAIVVMMLVDRGYLENKGNITVAGLVQHKSGIVSIKKPFTLEQLQDYDYMAKVLAQEPHFFNGETKSAYMAFSYGYYINELVRWSDPKKRALDVFVEEKINKPLNIEIILQLSLLLER